jgi:hypothetical protein
MKRMAFVVLAVSSLALASDDYKLSIAALNGSSVVSASDVGGGLQYFLQCPSTSTFRYKTCATSTCTAATTSAAIPTTGLDFWMPSAHRRVAVYGDGAAGTCLLFQVDPPTLPFPRGF